MDDTDTLLVVAAVAVLFGGLIGHAVARWNVDPDPRLVGTWVSDGDRTVAEWRERRPMTDDQAARLRALFGKMRVTWKLWTYVADLDGRADEHRYRVIARDDSAVVVRAYDPLHRCETFVTIHYVDGGAAYWLHAADGPLREYFRRVD